MWKLCISRGRTDNTLQSIIFKVRNKLRSCTVPVNREKGQCYSGSSQVGKSFRYLQDRIKTFLLFKGNYLLLKQEKKYQFFSLDITSLPPNLICRTFFLWDVRGLNSTSFFDWWQYNFYPSPPVENFDIVLRSLVCSPTAAITFIKTFKSLRRGCRWK